MKEHGFDYVRTDAKNGYLIFKRTPSQPTRARPTAVSRLMRQLREGGSWHVQVSLAQTAHWLRSLGRVPGGFLAPALERANFLETTTSGFGQLVAVRHAPQFADTPAVWGRPALPPGSHAAVWPDRPTG